MEIGLPGAASYRELEAVHSSESRSNVQALNRIKDIDLCDFLLRE
jgi:hypothetical protein